MKQNVKNMVRELKAVNTALEAVIAERNIVIFSGDDEAIEFSAKAWQHYLNRQQDLQDRLAKCLPALSQQEKTEISREIREEERA